MNTLNTLKAEHALALEITRHPAITNRELVRHLVKANDLRELIDTIENGG